MSRKCRLIQTRIKQNNDLTRKINEIQFRSSFKMNKGSVHDTVSFSVIEMLWSDMWTTEVLTLGPGIGVSLCCNHFLKKCTPQQETVFTHAIT